ncbi:MAG: acyl-CoA thioesterase [Candidatus Kapaibacterium sp.]|nr:MAG: acyl-CoA thioesterase [Candidatus Kapabacteria bacterium]
MTTLTRNNASITNRAEIRVRYAETDKMKVVYNGNYLTYFEVGRTELLRACGLPYPELERTGFLLPVLEAHVKYKMSAVYDDVLSIYATYTLERIPTIRIDYLIKRGDDEIASGYTVHPFVAAETMKPVRPPKVFFEAIERALEHT